MHDAEKFLLARLQGDLTFLLTGLYMLLHQDEDRLAAVLETWLVLLELANWVQEGDQALVKFKLGTEHEINYQGIQDNFVVVRELPVSRYFLDIHEVVQAEKRINIDSWLEIFIEL